MLYKNPRTAELTRVKPGCLTCIYQANRMLHEGHDLPESTLPKGISPEASLR